MYEYDSDTMGFARLKHKLWHLTIRESAELTALDMWVSGDLPDIDDPDDWDGDETDPRVTALLAEVVETLERSITSAVDSGRLKAKGIVRNFDESMIESTAKIHISDLEAWLQKHGYIAGERFDDWSKEEAEIHNKLDEECDYLRALSRRTDKQAIQRLPCISDGPVRLHEIDSVSTEILATAYKALLIENDGLRQTAYGGEPEPEKRPVHTTDKPLTTKPRRTLLTIIAALCDYSGINHQDRGVAVQIAGMTEEIGAAVDDGTIKKYLDEIPDALGTRMR